MEHSVKLKIKLKKIIDHSLRAPENAQFGHVRNGKKMGGHRLRFGENKPERTP